MKSITLLVNQTLLFSFILCLTGTSMAGAIKQDDKVQISTREFLCTAFEDPSLLPQNERIRFLKETPGGISYIENPEFRLTIDKFESNQQKYALRVKPRGWDEISSEKSVHSAQIQAGAMQRESLLHQALKNRYETVVDLGYYTEMRTLHESLNLLYEDWEHVLKRHVHTSNFDAGELADMETQRMTLQMEIMELKNQQDAVKERAYAQSGYGKNISFIDHRPLAVTQLSDRLSDLYISAGDKNIYLTQAKTRVAKAEAQYQLEVAEESNFFSFIETAYNAADKDDFGDAFSIEFGISIPIGSGNENSIRQQKLESMKARSEQQALERKIRQTIPVIRQKLHNLIKQYNTLQQKKTNSFSTAAFDRLLQSEGTNPLTLLKLKKGMLKADILQAKLSHMIFTAYIDLLDITGRLSKKPLLNYLSSNEKEGLTR